MTPPSFRTFSSWNIYWRFINTTSIESTHLLDYIVPTRLAFVPGGALVGSEPVSDRGRYYRQQGRRCWRRRRCCRRRRRWYAIHTCLLMLITPQLANTYLRIACHWKAYSVYYTFMKVFDANFKFLGSKMTFKKLVNNSCLV